MGGDHKCPVCDATFTRPQHVARHMRSHTGDRPYKCQYCTDQFARSDLLSRHVNKCHDDAEKPITTTTPSTQKSGRKGSKTALRATTSKQTCDQCVKSNLPCDGAKPCVRCSQRKLRCTYVEFGRQTAPVGPGHDAQQQQHSTISNTSGSRSSSTSSIYQPQSYHLTSLHSRPRATTTSDVMGVMLPGTGRARSSSTSSSSSSPFNFLPHDSDVSSTIVDGFNSKMDGQGWVGDVGHGRQQNQQSYTDTTTGVLDYGIYGRREIPDTNFPNFMTSITNNMHRRGSFDYAASSLSSSASSSSIHLPMEDHQHHHQQGQGQGHYSNPNQPFDPYHYHPSSTLHQQDQQEQQEQEQEQDESLTFNSAFDVLSIHDDHAPPFFSHLHDGPPAQAQTVVHQPGELALPHPQGHHASQPHQLQAHLPLPLPQIPSQPQTAETQTQTQTQSQSQSLPLPPPSSIPLPPLPSITELNLNLDMEMDPNATPMPLSREDLSAWTQLLNITPMGLTPLVVGGGGNANANAANANSNEDANANSSPSPHPPPPSATSQGQLIRRRAASMFIGRTPPTDGLDLGVGFDEFGYGYGVGYGVGGAGAGAGMAQANVNVNGIDHHSLTRDDALNFKLPLAFDRHAHPYPSLLPSSTKLKKPSTSTSTTTSNLASVVPPSGSIPQSQPQSHPAQVPAQAQAQAQAQVSYVPLIPPVQSSGEDLTGWSRKVEARRLPELSLRGKVKARRRQTFAGGETQATATVTRSGPFVNGGILNSDLNTDERSTSSASASPVDPHSRSSSSPASTSTTSTTTTATSNTGINGRTHIQIRPSFKRLPSSTPLEHDRERKRERVMGVGMGGIDLDLEDVEGGEEEGEEEGEGEGKESRGEVEDMDMDMVDTGVKAQAQAQVPATNLSESGVSGTHPLPHPRTRTTISTTTLPSTTALPSTTTTRPNQPIIGIGINVPRRLGHGYGYGHGVVNLAERRRRASVGSSSASASGLGLYYYDGGPGEGGSSGARGGPGGGPGVRGGGVSSGGGLSIDLPGPAFGASS